MRVLLIRPPYDLKSISPNFPIGIACLAASLRRAGHRPTLLDLPLHDRPWEQLRGRLEKESFPLAGISSLTVQYPGALRAVELIRRLSPRSRIVLGGPHPSVLPEEALRESGADFVIRGEGELALTALAEALDDGGDLNAVPSLTWLTPDGPRSTPPPEQPAAPDDLPWPAYDLLDLDTYFRRRFSEFVRPGTRPMPIFTSRGCPYQCTFCHELFGKRFRARSPESVVGEIRMLHDRWGVDEFLIYDDIFNLDLDRAKEIFRRTIQADLKAGFSFPNGMRAERMDAELMELMARAGVHTVTVAVESASERMQRVIKKRLKLPKVPEFLHLAKQHGIRTQAFFIIGFPEETRAEVEHTIDYARRLRHLDYAFFSFATPYPGTELARRVEALGVPVQLNMNSLDFYVPHLETLEFSFRRLKWLRLKASLLFYLTPRRLVRLWRDAANPQLISFGRSWLLRQLGLLSWKPERASAKLGGPGQQEPAR